MKKRIGFIGVLSLILLTACGHEHTFSEATCTEPATCTECGATEGEAVGHDYSKATCTEPATCINCGATEGEALGHTVEVGICSNCDEAQGKETAQSICDYVTSGLAKCDDALDVIAYGGATTIEEMLEDCREGWVLTDEGCTEFERALELCGDYPAFSELKSCLQETVEECPLEPTFSTNQTMIAWMNEYSLLVYTLDPLEEAMNSVASDFDIN